MAGPAMGADTFVGWSVGGQSALRTAVSDAAQAYVYLPGHAGNPEKKEETQFSSQARGGEAEHGRQGNISADGPIAFDLFPSGIEPLLGGFMEWTKAATAAASNFVVTNANKYIDFTNGGTFAAVVALGNYTAATLPAAIKAAMELADSGHTYTVTYTALTGIWRIAVNSGTFSILWLTGTNTATSIRTLIGYSAVNDTGALFYDGDTAAWDLRDNTFILPYDLALPFTYGQTVRAHIHQETMQYLGAFLTAIQWQVQNNFLTTNASIIAAERAFIATVTPKLYATYATTGFGTGAGTYQDIPMVVAGKLAVDLTTVSGAFTGVSVQGLNINVPVPTQLDYSDTDVYAVEASRTGKIIPEVSWSWKHNTATPSGYAAAIRQAWDSKEQVSLVVTLTGRTVRTTTEYIKWTFPNLIKSGADPKIAGSGPITKSNNFKASRDTTNSLSAMKIETRNLAYFA